MVAPEWISRSTGEAETRAGVEPIDLLLHERAELVKRLAPLWALVASDKFAERLLSSERAKAVAILRLEAEGRGEKVVEAKLEAESRIHPVYFQAVLDQARKREEYFALNAEYEALDFRMYRGQALLKAYSSEMRT